MEDKIFFTNNSENIQKRMMLPSSYKVTNKRSPRRGDIKIGIFKAIVKTIASTTPSCGGNGGFCRLRFRSLPVTPVENLGGGSGVGKKKTSLEYYSVCPKRGDVKMKIFKGIFHSIVSTISAPRDFENGGEGDNEMTKKS
ncbi:hypothetical protein LIER_05792 [Lithospermum erythrorhizon]|uniref:Uncharacterized protein n=1 Tax=Lithospermum erythrorhizon TaxID=34254 RepID=A0AAV3P232_LITER